jgi:alkylation response protein AidB-like acyl-CoA dehydrogenase
MNEGEIREFRAEATAFLDAHATRRPPLQEESWGEGDDTIGLLDPHPDRATEVAELERSREWRRTVFDAGFGWLGGPPEYGGAGRDPALDEEFRRLERQYVVPDQQPFATATHLVAPAILEYGSDDLKRRHLRPMFRGDVVACQLLSEPDAGSDLASLRTSAVRHGDEWIITGQKVWTSQAHLAEVGQLLARTDPAAPQHRGITMFVIDMQAPGVTVRPLRQMTGESHFNEVFLEEVRVPDTDRVGEPGTGWGAVMATLMAERAAVGAGAANSAVDPIARLTELADHLDRRRDPVVRQQLAKVHTMAELRRHLVARRQAAVDAGRPAGAEGSIVKLLFAQQAADCSALAGALLGPSLVADGREWGTFAWSRWVCGAPMLRIAGGTDEIQRNVLAERVLGLPKEPRR